MYMYVTYTYYIHVQYKGAILVYVGPQASHLRPVEIIKQFFNFHTTIYIF